MPVATVNSVRLYYELQGRGETPIVFVHGSWVSGDSWNAVAPALAEQFRVLTYDRRGHSRSERPLTQGSVREDVADLAALIDHLELAPAFLAGNSFGASIALRFAVEHPGLLRGLVAHEPPLFVFPGDAASESTTDHSEGDLEEVLRRIAAGDHAGAAEVFVDRLALGPGSWEMLPQEMKQTLVFNALTFLDEARDPEQLVFDPQWLAPLRTPIMLTMGDQSPPAFRPVVERLATATPEVSVFTYVGAGHIPHITHPEAYVVQLSEFVRKHDVRH